MYTIVIELLMLNRNQKVMMDKSPRIQADKASKSSIEVMSSFPKVENVLNNGNNHKGKIFGDGNKVGLSHRIGENMVYNLDAFLSSEDREKKQEKIEQLNQTISDLEWERDGEPDEFDNNFYEEQFANRIESQLEDLYHDKEQLEEQLFKDDYYRRLQAYQNQSQKDYSLGKILNDSLPVKDLLGREAKACQLANFICNDSALSSFNIGIIGEWGSGKSTFLSFIKKQLQKNVNKEKNISVLSYDASSYSEKNQIWANFAKILFEEYECSTLFPHIKYTFTKIMQNKTKHISTILLNIVLIFILFLLALGSKYSFSKNVLLGEFVGVTFSISGVILLITNMIIPWTKKALSASVPLSQKVLSKISLPSYIETLGTREQISSELAILFKSWIPKNNQKIVIFVDELDRCSDKGIAEFFQSIQLFSITQKLIFVFAIEPSHIKKALASSYEISENDIDAYTRQYLDKYVSIVIPIENNVSYANLAIALIQEVNSNNPCITTEEIETIKQCINTIPRKYMSPRKIKKIINLLTLTKDYCKNYYTNLTLNYCELFSWIILNCFFHDAAEYASTLFTSTKEYTPLKNVLNYSTQKVLGEKLINTPYLAIIEDFRMRDIVIYNKIANDFSIIIY